ncbi:hypothetical protein RhiirA1_476769 [Rhizophagus irregularis]|uniref:Uncharacterized protein n=1 Tax=Rhizophagus irregularis TaxID=588596 RepID=A0A2I1FK25_9GLOM|nr:hypothetical protein RhiirA1_476769 [Rhizophagus irregularis]PKY34727.1 hypothetical protein RhiirB3_454719 [Rhizophagus irregularis]
MDTLDQPTEAHEKIYNPNKSNRMIVINGSVYRKLLCGGYMYWREERLLIPPLHELPILKRYLSFISYRIWANWRYFTLCQLLKLCWEHKETKAWRINILMKFLHHLNLAPSKYRPSALYDAFTKTNVLGSEHILALA